MAKKKNREAAGVSRQVNPNVMGLRAEVLEQPITETLETNFMPYAMSVIVSRAIPEIDGFKPSHRKLLYTMYQMKLLGGPRTKSANVVGQTMKLNPHGDAAIYDTMVRLSRGYGALLHPLVDSKGNFGKVYSRDMAWAASRYTEVRLDSICEELFRDIDQDTVDFVDNYDGKMKEPVLLPTTFPNVLVAANLGIAVGMASNLCGFNLGEVCDTAIALIRNPDHDIMSTLKAPDLPTGGVLIYDQKGLEEIYETGRGSFEVRARWRYVKQENLIEVYEIPYSTTVEAILEKVTALCRAGKLREISDIRDETDLSGLKLAIDLKRGTDPDRLMAKLFRSTPLQDSQSCNFNILIEGMPRVMGVREILTEWTAWRSEGVRRRTYFSMTKKKEKLHLLEGLEKILLDMDRAIEIIRNTEEEAEVVPNLMINFGIDEEQAAYVADIRLRNINREYILKRTRETGELKKEIEDLEDVVNSPARIREIIVSELENVKKKYAVPRRTGILYEHERADEPDGEEEIPVTPVHVFVSREGYLKKITPQSLRMSGEQKYKEGDGPAEHWETDTSAEILVFTDKCQCWRAKVSDFDDTKASALGDYLPSRLGMDQDEKVMKVFLTRDYSEHLVVCFENGKAVRIEMSAYKAGRRKMAGGISSKSPAAGMFQITEDTEIMLYASDGRGLIFSTSCLTPTSSRTVMGTSVFTTGKARKVESACLLSDTEIEKPARYRTAVLPSTGRPLRPEDMEEKQMSLL